MNLGSHFLTKFAGLIDFQVQREQHQKIGLLQGS